MSSTIVLGAGIVGISTALALQARGLDVLVIDRKAPGQETSFGNAGVIQNEARAPYAFPREPLTLLTYALGRSNDVIFDLPALPGMAKALAQYFWQSAPRRHADISRRYAEMVAQATSDHAALITASGAEHLLCKSGLGEIFTNQKAFEARALEAEQFSKTHGLAMTNVDGSQIAAEEGLTKAPAGAVLWRDTWHVRDPGALVTAYAKHFIRNGGRVEQADITTLSPVGSAWKLETKTGRYDAKHVVVALGPWSPNLLAPLGYRIPMVMKRGYHAHYNHETELSRPYLFAQEGLVLSSMNAGLRVTTGAHLTDFERPQKLHQLKAGLKAISGYISLTDRMPEQQWHGTRPCLPGMLPLVGPSPKHQGLWFNFGHGHQGLTLGPTTGKRLAALF